MADEVVGGWPPGQQPFRHVEDLLEIAVPGGEVEVGIEHRYAVAHVIEGNAQFGLAIAQFGQKPDVLYSNDCLIGEGPEHLYLCRRERFYTPSSAPYDTDGLAIAQHRHAEKGAVPRSGQQAPLCSLIIVWVRQNVFDIDWLAFDKCPPHDKAPVGRTWKEAMKRSGFFCRQVARCY